MTFRTFTAAELVVSPLNVRINDEDANATTAFERSIARIGLIEPLIVHPLTRKQAKRIGTPALAAVLGGGRRFRAISRLVAAGTLAPDWPISCAVRDLDMDRDIAEITELSLAENMGRELRAYEIQAAVTRALADGATESEVAETLGQTVAWVRRARRLGQLAPEIFAAYADGVLEPEPAQAYAATEDHALQRAAWKNFGGAAQAAWSNPHAIRKWLKIGDFELARLLAFVGLDAYRTAGGRFELDLFYDGEQERGRVEDEGLLRKLAEERLEQLRDDVRGEFERADLRFIAAKPELSLFHEPGASIPADVVAHLEIGVNGHADLTWWWESKKARAAFEKASSDHPEESGNGVSQDPAHVERSRDTKPVATGSALEPNVNFAAHQAARAAVKDEYGLTGDGLHAMRSLRREILRAILVADAAERGAHDNAGTLGRDYLIWSQLRQELGGEKAKYTGARGLSGNWMGAEDAEPRDFVAPLLEQTHAHAHNQRALAIVAAEPFMTEPDPAASLALYVACDETIKNLAAAVLVGQALLRSVNSEGWRIPAHDKLAELAGVDERTIRKAWYPTPAFMGLFPKLKRLEYAQPFIDPRVLADWARRDDKTIAAATAAALDPKTHSDPAIAKAAGEWVHPLLEFSRPDSAEHLNEVYAQIVDELEPAE
jgi:ParB family chromosome partitioning protein